MLPHSRAEGVRHPPRGEVVGLSPRQGGEQFQAQREGVEEEVSAAKQALIHHDRLPMRTIRRRYSGERLDDFTRFTTFDDGLDDIHTLATGCFGIFFSLLGLQCIH